MNNIYIDNNCTLNRWIYECATSEISKYSKQIIALTRNLLYTLSGGNIVGLLSNILSEVQQISLSKVKPIFQAINFLLKFQ